MNKLTTFLCLIVCMIFIQKVQAQVSNIPTDHSNTRFYSDIFSISRPALSVIGFDNNGDNSHGYGLKQILNRLYDQGSYSQSAIDLMVGNYDKIVATSKNLLTDPFNDPQRSKLSAVNRNSNILQCRAFIALARYVLYKNGITAQVDGTSNNAKSYNDAIADLRSAFLEPEDWLLANSSHKDDPVKWTRTIGNYSRALDLYLALENAFDYYGESLYDSRLLTQTQKQEVMSRLFERIKALNDYEYSDAVPPWPKVKMYEAEAGNRPMKMFLAMGYGALTLQNYEPSTQNIPNTANDYLQGAFRSAGLQEPSNSIKYWSYQTHNGKRFWAEGPYYFEFTLNDVIPFWHAIRANNMLNWNGNNISDPFHHGWFLNPLSWLADLVTPNGYLPPLDDGNKYQIGYANLLRWSGTYGDATVGKKFAWIGDKIKDTDESKLDTHTLLVQLAMPQVSKNGGTEPASVIGNQEGYTNNNNAEQQLVARGSDGSGNQYYVLLNGESSNGGTEIIEPGDAIQRGEGHEQPDQLQLLYYVDGTSFLMDRGYDKAGKTTNSSWNFYKAHNVMHYSFIYQPSGLPAPSPDIFLGRKVSYHSPVDELYYKTPSNKVVEFNASQLLYVQAYKVGGDYKRNVLFIKGDEPYILDFNSITTFVDDYQGYNASQDSSGIAIRERMFYHGNSNSFSQSSAWHYWDIPNNSTNKDLYLYLKPVEFGGSTVGHYSVSSEELNNDPRDIQVADISNWKILPSTLATGMTRHFTTVAILKADNAVPVDPKQIFSYNSNNLTPYQGWYWQHDANTVDVIVKRSKVDMSIYDQNVDFTIDESGIFIPGIRLPAGNDYGFARFQKTNGVWQINPDYQVNLSRRPNTFVYTTSTIGTKTYPSNAHIYVADNSTLTITGDVTMQTGTTVHLGAGASINVNSGGRINAAGTTFQTISGSTASADRWSYIKLLSNGNTFSSCTFEGAEKGLYVASSGNMVNGGYFTANAVGLYLNSGDATLKGTIVEQDPARDGTDDGAVVRGTATLYLTANESGTFFPARFRDLDRGIDISDFGQVVAYETAFRRNDYNIHITGDGEFDGSGAIAGQGYNSIVRDPNTIYDIYNLSSNYAAAQFNWWGSSTEPPGDWRFYGNVTRMNPVSCDPTISGRHCDPISSGGGSCDPLFPCQASANLNSQGTLNTKSKVSGPVDSGLPSFDIPKIKDIIQAIYAYINKHPNDPAIPQYIRRIHTLLLLYDKDGSIRKWAGFDRKLDNRLSLFLFDRSTATKQATITDQGGDSSIQLGRSDVGQTVMMIHLDDALRQHNYAKVLKMAKKYEPAVVNNRFRASLIAAKAVAWEQTRQFGKALAAYEQIEHLNFKNEGEDGFQHPEYPIIKKELADSMAAHGQTKNMLAKTNDTVAKTKEETPNQIKVASPYPNPFNPTTTIPFSVPSKMHVAIKVYNMLGRRVATLTDKSYKAGRYEVRFNGDNVASGVYFIRSSIGNKSFVNEITLIK